MIEFPTLMYRVPGPYHGPYGTTYDFIGANTEEEAQALADSGWSYLLFDAVIAALGYNPEAPAMTIEETLIKRVASRKVS